MFDESLLFGLQGLFAPFLQLDTNFESFEYILMYNHPSVWVIVYSVRAVFCFHFVVVELWNSCSDVIWSPKWNIKRSAETIDAETTFIFTEWLQVEWQRNERIVNHSACNGWMTEEHWKIGFFCAPMLLLVYTQAHEKNKKLAREIEIGIWLYHHFVFVKL